MSGTAEEAGGPTMSLSAHSAPAESTSMPIDSIAHEIIRAWGYDPRRILTQRLGELEDLALHRAAREERADIFAWLLVNGAEPSLHAPNGDNPLRPMPRPPRRPTLGDRRRPPSHATPPLTLLIAAADHHARAIAPGVGLTPHQLCESPNLKRERAAHRSTQPW